MNKTFTARVRMTEEAWEAFRKACQESDANPSTVLRDFCKAATDYMEKHSRIPEEFTVTPCAAVGAPRDVPQNWIARALSKTHTLSEFKDVFESIIVAGLPLDWESAVGEPGDKIDYTREFDKAVDARLQQIRSARQTPSTDCSARPCAGSKDRGRLLPDSGCVASPANTARTAASTAEARVGSTGRSGRKIAG